MKVGDLVRLSDQGCFHPDDEYLDFGILLKIEKGYYGTNAGPITMDEGCHIHWSNNTFSIEPIQFIEKVSADVVE